MGSIIPMKEIDEGINQIILYDGEKQAILTVSPPIYAIGEKKLKNIQGFNGIRPIISFILSSISFMGKIEPKT